MNKLQIVTDKICELLKGSELDIEIIKLKHDLFDKKSQSVAFVHGVHETLGYWVSSRSYWVSIDELRSEFKIKNSPILEAEVLMALGIPDEKGCAVFYAIDNEGELWCYATAGMQIPSASGIVWQLGQPLSSQSPETIEFLFNVLNCEG